MTDRSATSRALRAFAALVCAIAATALAGGCESAHRNEAAIAAYYNYDFATSRDLLLDEVHNGPDEQLLLDRARLGLAALARGDTIEAERALGQAFELLSTAGLNEDRTIGSVLLHEGVRIWKGEPFEQALLYYWVSALYATMGDWENARAAASNALFRLTDFGADQDAQTILRDAADDEAHLDNGYTAVDTDFALGFLMQALASKLSGAGGADAQFDAALAIDDTLAPIIKTLRSDQFNTLLLIDYGKGPTKIAYGRHGALSKFQRQESRHGDVIIEVEPTDVASAAISGRSAGVATVRDRVRFSAVCDVDRMSVDHRWNNLEGIRQAKAFIGDAMVVSGLVVAQHGSRQRSPETALAGLGLILAGALTSSGARADVRYLEFAPASIYVVPLQLDGLSTLRIRVDGGPSRPLVVRDVEPGSPDAPNTIYVRLHGPDSPPPPRQPSAVPVSPAARNGK